MKLEGTHSINAPRDRVYESLVDPEVLQRCIPGCEELERTAPDTYAMTIRAGVGPIKGLFKGNVRLEDLREPEHYRLVVDGKGTTGFLKGAGDFDLVADGEATQIQYAGDVQVGGMIASVGQRMVLSAARMMASQFFTALEKETRERAG
ncbi:MAG TPA: carbon monoxide dehydrogenase subunit G [Pyrinomonadaceae bacterium]|nr:carbon monoxide dehydrogenase subunit G [Pyrinomonadaceae bacterium]